MDGATVAPMPATVWTAKAMHIKTGAKSELRFFKSLALLT